MARMTRKQIYLGEDAARQLRRLSQAMGTSEAELIRRAVDEFLTKAARQAGQGQEDPLLQLIGLCDSPEGPVDASVNHDFYLYGAPKRES